MVFVNISSLQGLAIKKNMGNLETGSLTGYYTLILMMCFVVKIKIFLLVNILKQKTLMMFQGWSRACPFYFRYLRWLVGIGRPARGLILWIITVNISEKRNKISHVIIILTITYQNMLLVNTINVCVTCCGHPSRGWSCLLWLNMHDHEED